MSNYPSVKSLSTNQGRFKSATDVSAQSVIMCERDSAKELLLESISYRIYEGKTDNESLSYLMHILLSTGCRVSEALALRGNDLSKSGHIYIMAMKGSNSRLLPFSFGPFLNYGSNFKDEKLFPCFNRYYVYREIKKRIGGLLLVGKSNLSVTHVFRVLYIYQLMRLTNEKKALSNALGHVSSKSIEYYVKKSKQ